MSNNSSGNGHDPSAKDENGKIIAFPSKGAREKSRKDKLKSRENAGTSPTGKYKNFEAAQKQIAAARASAGGHQPFFNFQGIPPFTKTLIAAIVLVHVFSAFILDSGEQLALAYNFGFISGAFTGTYPFQWLALITPLSHAFLHGGWMHLLLNSVMGLALGILYERSYGTRSTAIFFTLCTLGGALAHFALNPFSTAPIIGASGGISGLFAAFIYVMHYQNQGLMNIPAKYGPWPVLLLWGALLALPGLFLGSTIAWQAHLGGYITGIALIWVKHKKNKFLR